MSICDVSIIITTHNSRHWVRRCLESVKAQRGVLSEVIIVDNNSTDGTREEILRLAPDARTFFQRANLGPARARNFAIARSVGRYVLTLDHDAQLEQGFLENFISAADRSRAHVGMWSGKILRPDRRTLDSTGIVLSKRWRAFDRGQGMIDAGQWDKKREILGPSACAALYRRSLLEDIREGEMYFDESFFFLWEDVELAWRAHKRGWQGEYVPEAVAVHVRNGSGLSRRRRQMLSWQNRYRLIAKHGLWKPISRYVWYCGVYDTVRFALLLLINPLEFLPMRRRTAA